MAAIFWFRVALPSVRRAMLKHIFAISRAYYRPQCDPSNHLPERLKHPPYVSVEKRHEYKVAPSCDVMHIVLCSPPASSFSFNLEVPSLLGLLVRKPGPRCTKWHYIFFLHFKLEHMLWGGPYEAGFFHSSLWLRRCGSSSTKCHRNSRLPS